MSELYDELPEEAAYATDAVADLFEQAVRSGRQPKIVDFLSRVDDRSRLALLLELVKIDAEYRFRAGDYPTVGEYVQAFDELKTADPAVLTELSFHLKCAEQRNPSITLSSLGRMARGNRPMRCPHCAQPISRDASDSGDETCDGCGNRIRLSHPVEFSDDAKSLPRVAGRFRLLELVGVGAFGSVYRAEDLELRREVAVKYPRAAHVTTAEDRDRLLNEARSAAILQHPGIVQIHEIAYDENMPFIVCEFISGCTLADRRRKSDFSFRDVARLISAVADALHFAHERGIIHRDIKPSNILLDDSGVPHLADFGLARQEAGAVLNALSDDLMGTPAYMSPEQASGDSGPIDRRSDIYSLGVIIYELLTAERPFRGNTRILLQQVIHTEPEPPRSLNDHIPPDLESICLKAISKEPSRRFQTAADLRDDLRRFLAGQPTFARPVTIPERILLWMRRSPALSALILVSILATIGIAFGAVFYVQQLHDHADELNRAVTDAHDQRHRAETEEQYARQISYNSDMKLAYRYWADRRTADVKQILQRQSTAGRQNNLEWKLLNNAVSQQQRLLGQHTDAATEVAASSNGQVITSVGADGRLYIWRGDQPSIHHEIHVQDDAIYSVAVSPDGSRVAVGTSSDLYESSQVWMYDTETGKRVAELQQHKTNIESIRFSHDGKLLASAARNNDIHLWSFVDQSLRTIPNRMWHESIQFSPDSANLAGPRPESFFSVWDCDTLQVVSEIDNPNRIAWLSWSPSGDWIAYSAFPLKEVVFVDPTSGERVGIVSTESDVPISALAFTGRGDNLLVGFTDGTITRWSITARSDYEASPELPLAVRPRHPETVLHGAINCFANVSETSAVVAVADGSVMLIDDTRQSHFEELQIISARTGVVECSPDGLYVASGDVEGRLILQESGANSRRLISEAANSPITDIDFVASRRLVATAHRSGRLIVWSYSTEAITAIATFESVTPDKDEYPPSQVAFTPDATRLISADFDERLLRIWNLDSKECEATLKTRFCCRNAVVSSDGTWVATGHDYAYVWNLSTRKQQFVLKDGDFVTSMAFTPDSRFLVTGHRDGSIRIRQLPTGNLVHLMPGHRDVIRGLAITRDGRRLVSSDRLGRVGLWSLETFEEFGIFDSAIPAGTEVRRLSVNPTSADVYVGYGGGEKSLVVLSAGPTAAGVVGVAD